MANPWYRHGAAVLLAAILTSAGAVSAQSAPPGIAECAAIIDGAERLACYDRVSAQLTAVPPTPVPAAAPFPVVPPSEVAPPAEMVQVEPAPVAPAFTSSLIDDAWAFDPSSTTYNISLYRQNYLQIARYTDRVNEEPFIPFFEATGEPDQELDSTEARFQISFKTRLWASENRRWGFWAAYTQQSQWQIYNDDLSRPFRETNYEPELMLAFRPDVSFGGFNWKLFNFGYVHQSNGRTDITSRSWDRLYMRFGIERGNFALFIRPWAVLEDEDNPDITDYYGDGDITAFYKWRDHSFTLMGRGNVDTGKGAAQFTWTSPPILGGVRGYVQVFSGYGDSMIDYNWRQNAIGIGFALNDIL
jgi:phospholipase A1/A2